MHPFRLSALIGASSLMCSCAAHTSSPAGADPIASNEPGSPDDGGAVEAGADAVGAVPPGDASAGDAGGADAPTGPPIVAGPVPIQYPGSLQNPCFSPDSRSLVFTAFKTSYNSGVAVVGVAPILGGAPTIVSDASGQSVNIPGACWNGATNRIAFSSDVVDHDEAYVVSPDGTGRTRVTHRNALAWEPSLSPDGQWITFESHPIGSDVQGSIWKVKVDGTSLQQLTDGTGDDKEPNWSPKGDRILFQSPRNGNIDLFTIDTSGGNLMPVTTSPSDDTDASWSPDGKFVVYSSDQGGLANAAVFVVPAGGGTPKRVTPENDYCGAPSWSPDGKWIAYETTPGDPDTSAGAKIRIVAAPAL